MTTQDYASSTPGPVKLLDAIIGMGLFTWLRTKPTAIAMTRTLGDIEKWAVEAAKDRALCDAARAMLAALQAIDDQGRDANPNGDVIIPSEIWDLVQIALAKARGEK